MRDSSSQLKSRVDSGQRRALVVPLIPRRRWRSDMAAEPGRSQPNNAERDARPSSELSPTDGQLDGVRPGSAAVTDGRTHLSLRSKEPPSRFIEDLPEWKPYHLLSPTHRRKMQSPTRSHTSSRHSAASKLSTRRHCCGLRDLNRPRLPRGGRKTRSRRKLRKGPRPSGRGVSSAKAPIPRDGSLQLRKPSIERQEANTLPESVDREHANATIAAAAVKRRPSKLKKRPPSSCPSLRGLSYSEWRSSMVSTLSADVSRRSSKRTVSSKRSGPLSARGSRRLVLLASQGLEEASSPLEQRSRRRFVELLKRVCHCGNLQHAYDG